MVCLATQLLNFLNCQVKLKIVNSLELEFSVEETFLRLFGLQSLLLMLERPKDLWAILGKMAIRNPLLLDTQSPPLISQAKPVTKERKCVGIAWKCHQH